MKKLHSLAFYALITPVMTLGASALMAEESEDLDIKHDQRNSQSEQGNIQSDNKNAQGVKQSESHKATDRQNTNTQARKEYRGFMESLPANSMQVNDLIGADINTTGDEDVGSVDKLIIDESGQIVAIVVGVGGFLGMAEKNVAIGWDEVSISGLSDDGIDIGDDHLQLQIDISRDVLRDAPSFEMDD